MAKARSIPKTLHFKNKEGYRKWTAFGHIHGNFKKARGNKKIIIAGRPHKVIHTNYNKKR